MTKKWEENKSLIMRYYRDNNLPLREVKRVMERDHQFSASWGVHKYNCRRRNAPSSLDDEDDPMGESSRPVGTPPVTPGLHRPLRMPSGAHHSHSFCGSSRQPLYTTSPTSLSDSVGSSSGLVSSRIDSLVSAGSSSGHLSFPAGHNSNSSPYHSLSASPVDGDGSSAVPRSSAYDHPQSLPQQQQQQQQQQHHQQQLQVPLQRPVPENRMFYHGHSGGLSSSSNYNMWMSGSSMPFAYTGRT